VSTIESSPTSSGNATDATASDPVDVRRVRPVTVWTVVGLLFVLFQAYVYIRWFSGPDFHHPSTGTDPVPSIVKLWAWMVQIATIVGICAVIWWVARQVRRERRLTFDAILLIAWTSVMWQDPVLNYIRPQLFYNSYLISFGSWVEGIPGWISPNGGNLPSPLFMSGFGYFCCLFFSIGITGAMRAAKRRIPSLGVPGLLMVAMVTGFLMDLGYEVFMVRTSLYATPGTVHSLSLWGGERYQFPLYESLFWGFVWAASGALRYFRDDKGRSIVERGAESLLVSQRTQTVLRTFAVIGFLNAMYLIFNICINFMALQMDQTPTGYPTYLRNDMCGAGTAYACPGPEVPIPMSPGAVNQPDPASTG
jgi:hypothetical protein